MTNLMRILIINNEFELAENLAQRRPEFINSCDTLVKELANRINNNTVIVARLLQVIINRGYNVNNIWTLTENVNNRTSLIMGIYHPDVLRLFIAGGANPNTVINCPCRISEAMVTITPLLKAIDLCNTPAARILINAGADVNQRGNPFSHQQPMTPLAYAIQRGAADIVPLLLERGADL
jgi:ankyrin repeat protein